MEVKIILGLLAWSKKLKLGGGTCSYPAISYLKNCKELGASYPL